MPSFARIALSLVAALFAVPGLASAGERDLELPRATSLHVSPQSIEFSGHYRRQQLLVTAESEQGRLLDVTHRCDLQIVDSTVAWLDESCLLGAAGGRTEIVVRYQGLSQRIALKVADDFAAYPPVDFESHILPLFSKYSCNSGGCHGKQSGQNGFKLSVFGFDPRADHEALVRQARGRRLFPAAPRRSLLLRKATGVTPHGGGQRIERDSDDAELLLEWIRQGAPWGNDEAPLLTGIRVEPEFRILGAGTRQQILVTAQYSDGQIRDVTAAASYTGNADHVAEVDQSGRIETGKVPGEAAVTVNYMGQVGTVRVLVPRPAAPGPYPELPANSEIDRLVWAKLRQLGIVPSPPADDAAFLRRLYLDTIGTLPRAAEVRSFLADADPNKRRRVIDDVLKREEFADYWALKWADVLMVDREKLGERGAYEFHRWLRRQMASNRPYDEWVRELVAASGNSGKFGPVNFYRALRTPEELTRAVSQSLLGIRLDCAQCHHHPFDKWGQDDFYGLAGYFQGVERKPLGSSRELVFHNGKSTARLPLTGEQVEVRPPDGPALSGDAVGDPRQELADWLTHRDNPWFARLAANRLWKHFMGRGLVEPEDDLRTTNPATNEPLLAYLADRLVEKRYDLKAVMREIVSSRVYQLSSRTIAGNQGDTQNYSHYLVKRLPAEVLLDAVSQVTGSPEAFPGSPEATRAIELWDNRLPSYFLETFGRSERQSPCECGRSGEPTMAQALHLMNAPEIEAKIADRSGRVAELLATSKDNDRLVEELCLAALGRPPGEKQRRVAARLFASRDRRRAAEDFLWTLLNSYDFLFIR